MRAIYISIILIGISFSFALAEEFKAQAGYAFDIPSGWTAMPANANTLYDTVVSPDKQAVLTFVVEPAKPLNIEAKPRILDEIIDGILYERESGGRTVKVLNRGQITVAGETGGFVEFMTASKANPSEQDFYKTYVLIHGPLIYNFYYAAKSKESYTKNFSTVQEIVNSFKPASDEMVKDLL